LPIDDLLAHDRDLLRGIGADSDLVALYLKNGHKDIELQLTLTGVPMQELTFALRDFIRVNQVQPIGAVWPIRCPFDLAFAKQRLTGAQSAAISGTGIYLIAKGPQQEVVYLGLFKPMSGDIISLRWGRHLQTITWRGANIGLGPSSKNRTPMSVERRKTKLLAAATNPELRAVVQAAYDHDRVLRYKSTGNDTTPNRLRFADENWDEFATATPENILGSFSFHFLRMRPAADQQTAAMEIDRIERLLRGEYKPICNHDYEHPQHYPLRVKNNVPDIISAVRRAMLDVTRQDVTHCVTLG
jgi:hypothetical protein